MIESIRRPLGSIHPEKEHGRERRESAYGRVLSQQTVCWLIQCWRGNRERERDLFDTICKIVYSIDALSLCDSLWSPPDCCCHCRCMLILLLMQSRECSLLFLLLHHRVFILFTLFFLVLSFIRVTLRTTVTWCGLHQYSNDCVPFWCANIMNLKWKITGFISPNINT